MGGSGTDNSTSMVGHGKVNMEPNSLPVVATVAGDAKGKDNGARGETQHFGTIELNDIERLSGTIGRSI
jgi:hypothetical protein